MVWLVTINKYEGEGGGHLWICSNWHLGDWVASAYLGEEHPFHLHFQKDM